METTFIYALIDPRNDKVKYIGKSNTPRQRTIDHISEARVSKDKYKKLQWIRSLLKEGLKPTLEILDEVCENQWKFWEQHYISLYKSWGFNLCNHDNGGLGNSRMTLEMRNKISAKLKGNIPWNKGRKRTADERAAQSLTAYKRPVTQYDLENNVLGTFDSIRQAAKTKQIRVETIARALKRNCISQKQFRWKYV
jgi:hypothetical protein